jgi:multiple sugar transport system substrate-binding protein
MAPPDRNSSAATPTPAAGVPASSGHFSRLPLGVLMKAGVGLIVVLILGFLIFGVVIPMFFSNKDEKVTLTYWGLWEDPRVMQSIINDFQKENPTITVKYEQQEVKQYRDRLETRMQKGTGPDMFRFHNSWLPEIGTSIAPLPSDVITPDQFKQWYYPVIQSDLTKNGAIYGIPLQIDTLALFTNTDMFEAASLQPPTMGRFWKTARILTVG